MFYRILFAGLGLLFFNLTLQAQIVNIEDRRKTLDTIGWFGQLDLGGRYTRNSSEFLTLNGGLRLDRFNARSHLFFIADYQMARSGGDNFLNAGFGHLRYARLVNKQLSWEAFTQLQYDEKLKLNLRFLAGVGPRFQLVSGEQGNISIGALYMYEYDELRQVSQLFHDHRMSTYLSVGYQIGGTTTINNTTYYQPRLWNFDRTRISSVTSIVIKISEKISFTTRFNLTQDARINEVFPEVPKATFSWLNGLRLGF